MLFIQKSHHESICLRLLNLTLITITKGMALQNIGVASDMSHTKDYQNADYP